jgi:hypothetical protein
MSSFSTREQIEDPVNKHAQFLQEHNEMELRRQEESGHPNSTPTKKKRKFKFILSKKTGIIEQIGAKKRLSFVVNRPNPTPPAEGPLPSDYNFVGFVLIMKTLKFRPEWCWKKCSKQNYTRTKLPDSRTKPDGRAYTYDDLCSKGEEPNFTNITGLRGSTYMSWILNDEYEYRKLFELGNPLKKEVDGGLKWSDITKHIYNSGEMEGSRPKNNYDPRMKQDMFFKRPDNGRTISQFLDRLWYIVNKIDVILE